MLEYIFSNLKKALEKIEKNPQLVYTFVIAILIAGAFIFTSQRFIRIANDAQERLINVRIGSIQDAFVSFAKDSIDNQEYLNQKIASITGLNETIRDFRVIVKKTIIDENSVAIPNAYVVVASHDPKEVGKIDDQADFLYTIASSDPSHSVTIEIKDGDERLFKTARAIVDDLGNIIGITQTTQTLSIADKIIEKNIRNSIVILVIVIVLIMFLFFRHSKIIDYVSLYKKLKEIDQLKDDFVSMASHELRTPLSIIRGYVSMISESSGLDTKTKESLSKIDISVKDLDSLVTDILDVSKIQEGKMSFNMEKTNPSVILESVVKSFETPVKEKGIQLSFDKSEIKSDCYINVDKDRFKQALVNLIGNAVKYTNSGDIKVRQYEEKGRLYIRISDTGIGMSAEEKDRLFEKFYRIRNSETENIRGTGLGLWITAKIIDSMNGKITVESIKGVGSHFVISFPLSI